MPAQAWQRTVRWTTGHEADAALIVPIRLGEVLIHHVDLDIGYRPGDWPASKQPHAKTAALFNPCIGMPSHGTSGYLHCSS